MNLLSIISEKEDPSTYIQELALDPKEPLLTSVDPRNHYSVLHSCIILTAGEILTTILKIVKEVSDTKKPGLLEKLLSLQDKHKKTALLLAIQTEYLKGFNQLIDYGSEINVVESKFSSLQLAAKTNKKVFIKKLLEKGVDLNFSNAYGNALMVSIDNGCEASFDELIKIPELSLQNTDSINDNYLLKSVNLEMDHMTKLILQKINLVYKDSKQPYEQRQNIVNFFQKGCNKQGLAAIHIAAKENETETYKLLISYYKKFGVDWENLKDNQGKLPKEHLDEIQTYLCKKEKDHKMEQEKEDEMIKRKKFEHSSKQDQVIKKMVELDYNRMKKEKKENKKKLHEEEDEKTQKIAMIFLVIMFLLTGQIYLLLKNAPKFHSGNISSEIDNAYNTEQVDL